MAKQVVRFENFQGGEFGLHDKWNAPRNSFTGTNMLVYRTGELGVRPGLTDMTPDGSNAPAVGVVWKVGPNPPFGEREFWYGQGFEIRSGAYGGLNLIGTMTGGTAPTTPTNVGRYETGSHFYLVTNTGTGIYSSSLTTFTKLSGVPSSNVLALYGDRLVIAQPNDTLRYNDLTAGVSDFTNWPATTIIPVGDDTSIRGVHPQRGHLAILKDRGGSYILSGALGVNEVLRQANNRTGPGTTNSARAFDDRVWYMAGANGQSPSWWDGSFPKELWYLELPGNGAQDMCFEAMRDIDPGGVLALGVQHGGALVYSNDIWTKHLFDAPFNSELDHTFQRTAATASGIYFLDPANEIEDFHQAGFYILTDGGSSSTAPKFYGWSPLLDRPGAEGVSFKQRVPERAGDLSSEQVAGEVAFPVWHDNDGSEFFVKGVEVDFRSWNTGGSLTNHFDLQVDAYHRFNDDAPVSSLKGSWDQAGSISSSGGTARREVFLFGDQGLGNGFQLRFTNVRGVAFQRVHVIIDTRPARGV